MKIKIKNIGIVKDSTMSIDGLTIITGKNNSGKTTVGKTVYSLLDAVSYLSAKAREDKKRFIIKKLDDIMDCLELFRFIVHAFNEYVDNNLEMSPLGRYPTLCALFSRDYRHDMSYGEVEEFAHKIYEELLIVDVGLLVKNGSVRTYLHHVMVKRKEETEASKIIFEQISAAISILQELFSILDKDPQLIEYARESINQTLQTEFYGQIQPAGFDVEYSQIELYNDDACCFNVKISNNGVINDGIPVFFNSPYKKVYFIDNPFLFDDPQITRKYFRISINADTESFLDPSNIISHSNKLKYILRNKQSPSVLEQTLLNESLEKIKKEIDSILPGTFEFSTSGDFYVKDGTKLKVSNLATGSKMFSIIKILLEKGELDKTTMLILDEPEAHLHPSWQNQFAEIMVLLVKELGVNVLLTTHSSNFVLAIDAHMRKYNIQDRTNFYQTQFLEGGMVEYCCVNKNMDAIYKDFLQYLSEMKMLRNQIIQNAGDNE